MGREKIWTETSRLSLCVYSTLLYQHFHRSQLSELFRPVAVDFFTLFLSLCPQGSSIFLKCHTYLSWSLLLQGHQAPQWIASPTSLVVEVQIFQAGLIHPPLSHLVPIISRFFFFFHTSILLTYFSVIYLPFFNFSFSWVFAHKQDTEHIIRTRKGERPGART